MTAREGAEIVRDKHGTILACKHVWGFFSNWRGGARHKECTKCGHLEPETTLEWQQRISGN